MLEKKKIECIDGNTVMLAPAGTGHNSIGGNLYRIISNFLRKKRCKVFYETKVVLDESNRLIPDLIVVCDQDKIKENYVEGAPDFVVEILSPSTRKRDLSAKRDIYERFGVKEYWIIDPLYRSILVYRFDNPEHPSFHTYSFEDTIPVGISDNDCVVDFKVISDNLRFAE